MSDNFGTGFTGFKTRIDMIAADLGDTSFARHAVHEDFAKALQDQIERRTNRQYPDKIDWSAATDLDFDTVGVKMTGVYERRALNGLTLIASAPWVVDVRFALYEDRVMMEGAHYADIVAMWAKHSRYDSRARRDIDDYNVFMTDSGMTHIKGGRYGDSSSPKSTHAKSAAGAHKAMRSIVEKFAKVTFINSEAA